MNKRPYTPPTATVVAIGDEPRVMGVSQIPPEPTGNNRYHIGDQGDFPPHQHGNIFDPTGGERPTVTSKFKNGYWVDYDDEDGW